MMLRVVTLPIGGRPARAVVCPNCGQHIATVPGVCPNRHCQRAVTPDEIDLTAWQAADPRRTSHAA
jgi:hypothetical protein